MELENGQSADMVAGHTPATNSHHHLNEDDLRNLKPLTILRFPPGNEDEETTFYILGTAHVSRESCDAAAELIQLVKPDVVLLEVCLERQNILTEFKLKEPSFSEVIAEIRSGRATPFQAVYGWLLARVGDGLDVMPGEEFRVALKEAHATNAQVVLGDRPLSITLARVWGALSYMDKLRLITSLLWTGISMPNKEDMKREIERMKETDVLTEAIREFGKAFPTLIKPLLTERDQYMVHVMRRLSGRSKKVVAVVGAGHLQGIRENWEREIDIEDICSVPPKRRFWTTSRVLLFTGGGVMLTAAVMRFKSHH